MPFFDDPLAFFVALPPFTVVAFVFVVAFLEYVVPPFPGDSSMLLGFFVAGHGVTPPWTVFAAAWLGSMVGGAVAFQIGRRFGPAITRRALAGGRRKWASDRFRQLSARHGEPILIANRFLPVVRGVMLYGAGAFGLRFRPAMVYNALSAGAFVGLLLAIGLATADSWEQIHASFRAANRTVGLVMAVLVAIWLVWRLRSRARLADLDAVAD